MTTLEQQRDLAVDIAWSVLRAFEGMADSNERLNEQLNRISELHGAKTVDYADLHLKTLTFTNTVRRTLLDMEAA